MCDLGCNSDLGRLFLQGEGARTKPQGHLSLDRWWNGRSVWCIHKLQSKIMSNFAYALEYEQCHFQMFIFNGRISYFWHCHNSWRIDNSNKIITKKNCYYLVYSKKLRLIEKNLSANIIVYWSNDVILSINHNYWN